MDKINPLNLNHIETDNKFRLRQAKNYRVQFRLGLVPQFLCWRNCYMTIICIITVASGE